MRILLTLFCLLTAVGAHATLISVSVGPFDGTSYTPPETVYDLEDFIFDLQGETIVSARLDGIWGKTPTYSGSTAHAELYVDGLLVADTHDPDLSCDPISCVTPWSYTFTDFTPLEDGALDFVAVQTSVYFLRLGATTLTIETTVPGPDPVAVPEPATLALLGLGLAVAGVRRRLPVSR